jgi:hypothetical protein
MPKSHSFSFPILSFSLSLAYSHPIYALFEIVKLIPETKTDVKCHVSDIYRYRHKSGAKISVEPRLCLDAFQTTSDQ